MQPVYQLGLGMDPQLAEDGFEMVAHCVLADLKQLGDGHYPVTLEQMGNDVALAP